MSVRDLFERTYRHAITRGHVVHSAVAGFRQIGLGHGESTEEAHATFRFAEQIVDAADSFYLAVQPRFRRTFKNGRGDKLKFVEQVCPTCGHPYCGLYAMAQAVPTNRVLPQMVALAGPGDG